MLLCGGSTTEVSWEPAEGCRSCPILIQAFERGKLSASAAGTSPRSGQIKQPAAARRQPAPRNQPTPKQQTAGATAYRPGKHVPGKQAPGKQAPGKQAPGKQAPGKQARGKQAPGKQARGKQVQGKGPLPQSAAAAARSGKRVREDSPAGAEAAQRNVPPAAAPGPRKTGKTEVVKPRPLSMVSPPPGSIASEAGQGPAKPTPVRPDAAVGGGGTGQVCELASRRCAHSCGIPPAVGASHVGAALSLNLPSCRRCTITGPGGGCWGTVDAASGLAACGLEIDRPYILRGDPDRPQPVDGAKGAGGMTPPGPPGGAVYKKTAQPWGVTAHGSPARPYLPHRSAPARSGSNPIASSCIIETIAPPGANHAARDGPAVHNGRSPQTAHMCETLLSHRGPDAAPGPHRGCGPLRLAREEAAEAQQQRDHVDERRRVARRRRVDGGLTAQCLLHQERVLHLDQVAHAPLFSHPAQRGGCERGAGGGRCCRRPGGWLRGARAGREQGAG